MPQTIAPGSDALMVLSVEDRLDIHELIAEYAHYEDNGDAVSWAKLFTSDGGFFGSDGKKIIGHDNLTNFATRRWADKPQVRNWVHWTNNVVIWPSAEGAISHSYQMVIEKNPDGNRIVKMSGKADELRRENGKWRFYARKVSGIPVV